MTGRRPSTRLVLAVSLDGRLALPEGGPAPLGGRGDRRVLEEALAWADGALIGAGTLRCHGSTCLIHAPDLLAARNATGRAPQPVALVASRSGVIPPQLPFFRQPLERWLLAAAAPGPAAAATGFARLVPHQGAWSDLLGRLAGLGLERLAVLGGAALAGSLLGEGLVDELQLTVCPRLVGGPHTWLPAGQALADCRWELGERRELEGGELLLRYGFVAPAPAPAAAPAPPPAAV